MSARSTQKEATRNRVIGAARGLFDSLGYEGTTIRAIAREAGVSVGSVFTTFASKGDILSLVMQTRLEALYAELDRLKPGLEGSTADRLRAMFATHFAFEAQHVRLFLTHIAAAYDWTLSRDARPFGATPGLISMIRDCLSEGVERGDVDPAADLDDVADLIVAAYSWTYHLVASRGAGPEDLTEVMNRRIAAISRGFQPR